MKPQLRRLSRFWPQFRLGLLIGFIILLGALVVRLSPFLLRLGTLITRHSGSIVTLTQDPASALKSTGGSTQILLLGLGGPGHDGADLTDSMILLSIKHQTKKATLISLPRDIYLDSLKTKINAVYYYGEQSKTGGGLTLVKSAISEVTGLPVHYAFAIDFTGFKKAIDLVGGVTVDVPAAFDDYKYPIPGKETAYPESSRYEHLHFAAGVQTMNGETALKFVRSRNAAGDEGTDFARSKRQQLVMLAFKDKAISYKTLLDPTKLNNLLDLYGQYIRTDLTVSDYISFGKVALSLDRSAINSIPLTTGDEKTKELGILEHPSPARYSGQWVLIARDNNWDALRQYISSELDRLNK